MLRLIIQRRQIQIYSDWVIGNLHLVTALNQSGDIDPDSWLRIADSTHRLYLNIDMRNYRQQFIDSTIYVYPIYTNHLYGWMRRDVDISQAIKKHDMYVRAITDKLHLPRVLQMLVASFIIQERHYRHRLHFRP